MSPETLWAALMAPPLSHLAFGSLGGVLYILRQHLMDYVVMPAEYVARPLFGAVVAYLLTVALGLPNHETSLFVGYFGVDIWDAMSVRSEASLATRLSFRHEKKPPKKPPPSD